MSPLTLLPIEILESIIRHLLDRKVDDFDGIANQDLQNVRLVCKAVWPPSHFVTRMPSSRKIGWTDTKRSQTSYNRHSFVVRERGTRLEAVGTQRL